MDEKLVAKLSYGYAARRYDLDKRRIEAFIDDFFHFVFFQELKRYNTPNQIRRKLVYFKKVFYIILYSVLQNRSQTQEMAAYFFEQFPKIYDDLMLDANSILETDPAAQSLEDILYAYPGFYAIAIYRFSHGLFKKNIPLIPRIWTELAHAKTGVDINPGAQIDCPFIIDHGTGIVIGETAIIGKRVKIYQGVTLGASSVSKKVAHTKRHPTIEDDVVIYANATVLGGQTIIGHNSILGGNVWVTESLPPNSVVYHKEQVIVKNKDPKNEPLNFII